MAQGAIACTPTSVTANRGAVTMAFTTFAPDGTTPDAGQVTINAFGSDGLPLSPAAMQAALLYAARTWYTQKYGPNAVPCAVPAAFQIN